MEPFIATEKVSSESIVEEFCTCRYSVDEITDHLGGIVCCNMCEEWFHQVCLDVPDAVFERKDERCMDLYKLLELTLNKFHLIY